MPFALRPSVFHRPSLRRVSALGLLDILIGAFSLYSALFIKFDGIIEERYRVALVHTTFLLVAIQTSLLYLLGMYHVQWRHAGLRDLIRVFYANTASTLLFAGIFLFFQPGGQHQILPRTVMVISFMISTALFAGVRLVPRLLRHSRSTGRETRRPALIYGAGTAGEQLSRDMLRSPEYPFYPAAFVDDDPRIWGTTIHGRRVLRGGSHLSDAAETTGAKTLLVAAPSASTAQIRCIVEYAREAEIPDIKILPGLTRFVNGEAAVNQLREVNLEDLMGREEVSIHTDEIEGFLRGKRLLITGAAGSIGSELVRRSLLFHPEAICLLDHDETELYRLLQNLTPSTPATLLPKIADVRDQQKIHSVFTSFRPNVVFHAAAYKHVPMIEDHPSEAAKTNIRGTRNVAEAAARSGCEKFIMISTDKAVNPTSVMGVTKRIAERVIREISKDSACTFSAVRFGNVLGSRGSVVPLFQEQIARRGPVTLTHPDMKRYFMTTDEACLLVLQAAAMARNGEVLVLDMGEPVMIETLARELIRLSGFEPDVQIPIVYTGIRPGEKLFEEYLTAEEGVDATRHKKIFIARLSEENAGEELSPLFEEIEEAVRQDQNRGIIRLFQRLVPTYTPDGRHQVEPHPQQTPA